jgi:hypothetical protein
MLFAKRSMDSGRGLTIKERKFQTGTPPNSPCV